MSRRIENAFIIEPEANRTCQTCGKTAECRPYGPGGTDVCFECGMKDREGTRKRMTVVLFGETPEDTDGN